MEQLARELEEKRRQELERLKEEELKNSEQGKRKTGKDQENALRRESRPGVKQVRGCLQR